jgi:hypothetical protein
LRLLDHGAFHCWNAPYGAKRFAVPLSAQARPKELDIRIVDPKGTIYNR